MPQHGLDTAGWELEAYAHIEDAMRRWPELEAFMRDRLSIPAQLTLSQWIVRQTRTVYHRDMARRSTPQAGPPPAQGATAPGPANQGGGQHPASTEPEAEDQLPVPGGPPTTLRPPDGSDSSGASRAHPTIFGVVFRLLGAVRGTVGSAAAADRDVHGSVRRDLRRATRRANWQTYRDHLEHMLPEHTLADAVKYAPRARRAQPLHLLAPRRRLLRDLAAGLDKHMR